MGKFISGLPNNTNLDKWADYAKRNSYGDNKRQCRGQLARAGRHDAENDWSDDWQQPQKSEEGRGWADINKGGRRRASAPARSGVLRSADHTPWHGLRASAPCFQVLRAKYKLMGSRCGDEGTSGYSFGSGCHSHGLRNCSPREYSTARRCGRAGPHPSMRKEVPADAVTPGLLLLSERLISSGTFT